MHWLDSSSPEDNPKWPHDKPGVTRGPATVTYSNIKVGEIDSTYGKGSSAPTPSPTPTPAVPVGAECCTASLPGGDPCEMYYRGAVLTSDHWCAQTKDRCGQCGGTWCPNGAKETGP